MHYFTTAHMYAARVAAYTLVISTVDLCAFIIIVYLRNIELRRHACVQTVFKESLANLSDICWNHTTEAALGWCVTFVISSAAMIV